MLLFVPFSSYDPILTTLQAIKNKTQQTIIEYNWIKIFRKHKNLVLQILLQIKLYCTKITLITLHKKHKRTEWKFWEIYGKKLHLIFFP